MGIINPTLPTPGQPRGSEETDVRNVLTEILNLVNGSIDAANLAASAKPATLLGRWRTITEVFGECDDINSSAATYVLGSRALLSGSGSSGQFLHFFHFDPADFVIAGLATKLQVKAAIATNTIDPGSAFTFGLCPVTASGGGAGLHSLSVGAMVAGSSVLVNPAASQTVQAIGPEFDPPAAGFYALALTLGGAVTLNARARLMAQLRVRHI